MSPVDASIARPAGSAPELIDHVFGSATVAVICKEYGVPTVAGVVASGPSVSFASPWLMLMTNSSSELHFEPQVSWQLCSLSSLTVRKNLKLPASVGVPLISP